MKCQELPDLQDKALTEAWGPLGLLPNWVRKSQNAQPPRGGVGSLGEMRMP